MSKGIEIHKQITDFNKEINIDLLDCELWVDKIIFILKFEIKWDYIRLHMNNLPNAYDFIKKIETKDYLKIIKYIALAFFSRTESPETIRFHDYELTIYYDKYVVFAYDIFTQSYDIFLINQKY